MKAELGEHEGLGGGNRNKESNKLKKQNRDRSFFVVSFFLRKESSEMTS